MKLDVPAGHKVGMKVPKGGSDCAKCEYVSKDSKRCGQTNFQKWNGSDVLPEAADEYCCDFFSARYKRKTIGEELKAHRAKK
jgi:hypothetical protein